MNKFLLLIFCLPAIAFGDADYASSCSPLAAAQIAKSPFNKMTMVVAHTIETGKGYEAKNDGPIIDKLQSSATISDGRLQVTNRMNESFCSAGTYLAFLKVIQKAQSTQMISVSRNSLQALLPKNKSQQPDGVGAWGRWNSDGLGIAILYRELGLGHSTHNMDQGEQGDFAKIDWTNGHGHTVIFDSVRQCKRCESCAAETSVCYWSMNTSNDSKYMNDGEGNKSTGGWGFKCLPKKLVKQITISHVDDPGSLDTAGDRIGASPSNPNYRNEGLVSGAKMTESQQDRLAGIGLSPTTRAPSGGILSNR